ncbi:MAG: ABC transporter permease [Parvibaculaceae bacterium]
MTFFGQLLVNGLMLGAVYALAAVAYTLVYGVVRLINFAFGELFMIGAFVTASLMLPGVRLFGEDIAMPGLPFALAAILAIVFVAALGFLIERIAYRPLRNAPRLAPLITAIAVSVFLQSAAQTIWGAEELRFPEIPAMQVPPWVIGGVYVSAKEVLVLVIAIVTMAGLTLLVNHTNLGRAMRATASDLDAAYLVGIPVNRIIAATFAIGSGLAALAGLLYAQAYGFAHPTMGFLPGLKALTAAVLGGIGSFPGAALGGVLLALIESFGAGYLPHGSAYKDAISFALLILLLYFRPEGLLGRKELNDAGQGSLLSYSRSLPLAAWISGAIKEALSRLKWQSRPHGKWLPVAVFAAAASLAFLAPSDYWLRVLIIVVVYGTLATGLNIVVGFTGLLDLGFVAFWAIGSYFTSILFILVLRNEFGIEPSQVWWLFYINLIAGGLVAATFGLILGYPTLRLRGDYLAIMTLGFGEIIRIVATNWVDLTRGPMGIRGIPSPRLFGWSLASPKLLYLLILAIAAAILFGVSRLVSSYVGRAWIAIRDDERAAEAMGVDTSRYKLWAYAFGGLIGGSTGVFFAHFQQYISPNSFTLFDNIVLMMLIVLGGLGTLVGPFVGAAIWILFLQVSQSWGIVQAFPESRYAMLGALLILLMIYQPQGLAARARPSLILNDTKA